VAKRVALSAAVHYWNQPVGLSFTEHAEKPGGAVDVTGRYILLLRHDPQLKSLSLDLGLIYKSAGFLPEETALGEHFGVRFGLSLGFSTDH
jgi:hypothetical protein